jgi:hypothetical protein
MRFRPLEPGYSLRRSRRAAIQGATPCRLLRPATWVRVRPCQVPAFWSLHSAIRPTGYPGRDPRTSFPLSRIVSETRPTMSCRPETQYDRLAGTATCTPSTSLTSFHCMIFGRGALCHRGRVVGGGLCFSHHTHSAYARVVRALCGDLATGWTTSQGDLARYSEHKVGQDSPRRQT